MEHNDLYWGWAFHRGGLLPPGDRGRPLAAHRGPYPGGGGRETEVVCWAPSFRRRTKSPGGSWTHGIEHVGVVRDQELWPSMEKMVKGSAQPGTAPTKDMGAFYHSPAT